MTNEKVKLFGWKTLTNKNSEVFKNLGEEQLQNPFVITWLLDCRNYDEKESSPHQFIKTIKNKNFLRYAKSDFIEFIIQKATTDFDLIELVLDLIDHCDILVIRGLLYSRAEVFKGLIYTKDALVSTSALRILDFCLVEREKRIEIFNSDNLSQILVICVKCWKENLPVDTSRLLDLVLHNARVGSTVVDDFVKTCINELEVFVVSDIDHTASLPVQQFQTMTVNPESSTALKQGFKKLSRPGVVEMLVAMEKISNSGHATTTSLYALHLDLEFYESLGQEILKGLEEEAENMREHNLEKYLDVFRLHVEYISKSPPTTKSADFIDIFQILLQASIQSLFTNINSPLVPLCLDIAVTLVDNDLLKLDELDTQRLRQSIGGSDPYLCLVISKLIKTPIDGRTMSELVNSSKPEYVKAVLGYIDVEVLVGYHRRKDDGDGNAVVEMAREFRNVVKDLKRKHQVEIDEVKGAFLAEEVMEEVQRVCGENLELRAKSGELESKFGGLEANVQGLEKEVEKARAVNAGLDMAMKKCESENAELIKKMKAMQEALDTKQQEIDELKGMVEEEREYQQVLATLAEKVSARKKFGSEKPTVPSVNVLRERNTEPSRIADLSAVMFE